MITSISTTSHLTRGGVGPPLTSADGKLWCASAPDPGVRIGRYHVLGQLGAGGMGSVYAAFDPDLDRKLAIKVLSGHEAEAGPSRDALADRLAAEARALARLSHPNVLPIFDFGIDGDRMYIAAELVAGANLRTWLEDVAPGLAPAARQYRAVAIMREVGEGLAAAHAAGIVHRDVKPENLMLGADGRVRVVDFGLALDDSTGAEHGLGRASGTAKYMAPEQRKGGAVDAASDQFAFCLTLYELVSGALPQSRADAKGGTEHHDDMRMPSWLRALIQRGLCDDPRERFPSMQALLEAMDKGSKALERRRTRQLNSLLVFFMFSCVVGALWVLARGAGDPCAARVMRLADPWLGGDREASLVAFRAARMDTGEQTWYAVTKLMSSKMAQWQRASLENCASRRERGFRAGSGVAIDLERSCLAQQRAGISALAESLSDADEEMIAGALAAAQKLPRAQQCLDNGVEVAPGEMALSPTVRADVSEIRAGLAKARVWATTSRFVQAEARALRELDAARALDFSALEAEAEVALADIYYEWGRNYQSHDYLWSAYHRATALGYDGVAARATALLTLIDGYFTAGPAVLSPHELVEQSKAQLERVGRPPRFEADWLARASFLLGELYDVDTQIDALRRAEPLYRETLGEAHPHYIATLHDLAYSLMAGDHPVESHQLYTRTLSLTRTHLGISHSLYTHASITSSMAALALGREREVYDLVHQTRLRLLVDDADLDPRNHTPLTSGAMLLGQMGYYAEALAMHRRRAKLVDERARSLWVDLAFEAEALAGSGDVTLARQLLAALEVRLSSGELEQPADFEASMAAVIALVHTAIWSGDSEVATRMIERGRELDRHPMAQSHLSAALSLAIAQWARLAGNFEQAVQASDRAWAQMQPQYADQPKALWRVRMAQARARLQVGRFDEAHEQAQFALRWARASVSVGAPALLEVWATAGRAAVALGDLERARACFEAALDHYSPGNHDVSQRAHLKWDMARLQAERCADAGCRAEIRGLLRDVVVDLRASRWQRPHLRAEVARGLGGGV